MTDPFEPPHGDAGSVSSAATTLGSVHTDLRADVGKVKGAVATALTDWRAKRRDDFEHGVFGMQVQLAYATEAADRVATILSQYAKALAAATTEVADLKAKAQRAQHDLDELNKKKAAGVDVSFWDVMAAEARIVTAKVSAGAVKTSLDQLAQQLATQVDAETSRITPSSSALTPADIRRQVDSQMGIAGLSGGTPNGGLSTAQAWSLVGAAGVLGSKVLDIVEDNADGELPGGPVTWLTTDVQTLQDLLDAARADGIAPTSYAGLLAQYWTCRAADQAGIDLTGWDPSKGVDGNRSTISAVYTFYGNLFLNDPKLQWAGMANMIGPSFAGGFLDLNMFKHVADDLSGPIDEVPGWARGLLPYPLPELDAVANMSADEFAWYQNKFLAMQKHIFFDQGAMHMAYTAGGLNSINEMAQAGLIDSKALTAWQLVDSGDPGSISTGNTLLLDREQNQIIKDQYDQMRNHDGPVGDVVTYLMTAVGSASIPGTKTPGEYSPLTISGSVSVPGPFWPISHETVGVKIETPLPDFNISDKDARWDYVINDTLPAYQKLLREHPDEARAIIATPVDDRIDEQRLAHRWPKLVENGLLDWDVSVNGGIGWGPW